jgi:hypothetical protein
MTEATDITLQINLCAGDAEYAHKTVPPLVEAFRGKVDEVLVVLDRCLPQASPVFRPSERFDAAQFAERLEWVRALCDGWLSAGLIDRLECLTPSSAVIRELNQKYTGEDTPWTHDHWGHAFTAYFAAWELPRTRYVLHFDADIFLYDATGGAWLRDAIRFLQDRPEVVALTPRIAPPPADRSKMVDIGAKDSGWLPTWELEKAAGGWRSNWLSTRFHFLDRERLQALLPLYPNRGAQGERRARKLNERLFPVYGWRAWTAKQSPDAWPESLHSIFRKAAHHWIPPYPLPPEVLFFEKIAGTSAGTFYLDRDDVWYVHPETKPEAFLDVLDNLLARVPRGEFPEAQRGLTGIQFGEWRKEERG